MDSCASHPLANAIAGDDRFTLALVDQQVMLALQPAAFPTPGAAEIFAALGDLPIDDILTAAVLGVVREPAGEPVAVATVRPAPGPGWVLKVSPNRLAAWVVPGTGLAAGAAGPAVITDSDIRAALAVQRIAFGVLDDAVALFAGGQPLEAPVRVARGLAPSASRNARIEVLVDTTQSSAPRVRADGSVDFHEVATHRSVEPATVLARRDPPVAGVPGRDVYGRAIQVAAARDLSLSRNQGKGTAIEGEDLVAVLAGRPVITRDRIDILPVYEVKGDVGFGVGNIDFPGDVVIRGDVQPGFTVRAGGTVTIQGIADRATISAGHDIAARGITGDQTCSLEAGGDVIAHYLHNVTLRAGGRLRVQREIVNCRVECARVEVPAGGRIVGGRISARDEIIAGTIGSNQSTTTIVEVLSRCEGHRGVVRAAKVVHPGVVIAVGNATHHLEEERSGTSFWESESELICLGPGSSDPADEAVASLGRM